ncbi:MAG: hypothetical protein BWY74_00881 [Firmicutes bacterium ADurb.Bin419]|nr:MAG: hypothetical protein BWY74_00881 [Firmicutes bacterium ADurb.Bin419]
MTSLAHLPTKYAFTKALAEPPASIAEIGRIKKQNDSISLYKGLLGKKNKRNVHTPTATSIKVYNVNFFTDAFIIVVLSGYILSPQKI